MAIQELAPYEVLQHRFIEDIRSDGWLLRHRKSGARLLLLSNDDNNKVFHITFRTTPKDSTGVAHITEHSVLCGSREFPLKDPFVELVKGSLNTFLNAMTYPDKTMYPVASCNDRDFANLMHVYLDAVFYPNTYRKEEIFRQEGWHYELEEPDGELIYNGVVYNEMKGAFSSPEDVLERAVMNGLFPDNTYGVESGGDPVHIPELTYEAFLDFHRTYYHPSNSYIYLYGNMDMEERLMWMDEHYLSHFDRIEVDSGIRLQQPFGQMKTLECTYPVSEDEPLEENTYLCWNAVIGTSLDVELANAFAVLEYALIEAPGAPLKHALLDAGIGRDILSSYDSGIYQPVFEVMAKNAESSDKDRFLATIRETLQRLTAEGIDRKSLLAGINLMEFKFREADYGSLPKGLIYGIDLMDSWLYDDTRAFDYLEQLHVYDILREKVSTGYFEDLVRTWLLENPHSSLLTAVPERGKTEKEEERVAKVLKDYKASLSEDEISELIRRTRALREFQDAQDPEEILRKIPMLERSDIDPKAAPLVNRVLDWDGVTVLLHDLFTNGIAYIDLLFNADHICEDEIPLLALLRSVLGMVDTEHYSYGELNNEINASTGGISAGISVFPQIENNTLKKYFGMKIRALSDKVPFSLEMVKEILFASSFENERRLREIIDKIASRLSMALPSSGHVTAATRAMANFSSASAFQDSIAGVRFYSYIQDLQEHFDERIEGLKADLERLCGKLFVRGGLLVSITLDEENFTAVKEDLAAFFRDLPPKEADRDEDTDGRGTAGEEQDAARKDSGPVKREGLTTAGQVQYVARAGNFADKGFAYTGVLRILKVIMGYEYLWLNIRVKGGAYGCMSSYGRGGDTYFVSYRDPKLRATNDIFDGIPTYLKEFTVSDRDMTKYIIGTVSDLDVPRTPQSEGIRSLHAFMCGITEEMIQRERDEILAAQQDDIRALAPLIQSVLDQQYFCAVGNEGRIQEAEDMFDRIRPLI